MSRNVYDWKKRIREKRKIKSIKRLNKEMTLTLHNLIHRLRQRTDPNIKIWMNPAEVKRWAKSRDPTITLDISIHAWTPPKRNFNKKETYRVNAREYCEN
jgi:hypothetical protein